jgi:hypothetical protein
MSSWYKVANCWGIDIWPVAAAKLDLLAEHNAKGLNNKIIINKLERCIGEFIFGAFHVGEYT